VLNHETIGDAQCSFLTCSMNAPILTSSCRKSSPEPEAVPGGSGYDGDNRLFLFQVKQ
ncbi:hypothetical protein P7K49_004984, partial [Saguinus oedipus]